MSNFKLQDILSDHFGIVIIMHGYHVIIHQMVMLTPQYWSHSIEVSMSNSIYHGVKEAMSAMSNTSLRSIL